MEVIHGSTFSGIGGFDLGMELAGMETAFQCEINKACRRVLERRFPHVRKEGDVTTIETARLPRVHVLSGGFPCQDVSVAGRRKGLAGDQSGLFFSFVDVLAALTPEWVLLENVPGLLSSNEGRDMGTVLGTLAELGYGWAYRVLDAQYFGVAQRRDRVFIVGCLGDPGRAGAVLFESSSVSGDPPPRPKTRPIVPTTVEGGLGACSPPEVIDALRATDGGADVTHAQANQIIAMAQNQRGEVRDLGDLAGALAAEPGMTQQTYVGVPIVFNWQNAGKEGLAITEDASGPLDASQSKAVFAPGITWRVRRLMPIECERLQGFPDNWTKGEKVTTRWRMLGNAVPVPVVEWIGRRMMAA